MDERNVAVHEEGKASAAQTAPFSRNGVVAQHLVLSSLQLSHTFVFALFVLWFGCSGEFDLGSGEK